MALRFQAVRGMNDFVPEATAVWQHVEQAIQGVLRSYGYREIRMPLVERTELFARSLGESSDVVGKEMYSFEDRGGKDKAGESLSLRPEGTASCVRAAIQQGLLHAGSSRLWYQGPMFRRERPQKGRYRQFHQIGVETFGIATPDIDAELIGLSAAFWQRLKIDDLRLELNSLGSSEARAAYRDILVEYFSAYADQLDEDSQRRLHSNPLRILDSKNPALAEIIAAAPKLSEHLDAESAEHFGQVTAMLDAAGITYHLNPRLVRGLDYYNRTVFEWKTDRLGAQDAVCSGGRYDGLVSEIGGQATPASGFALGMERVIALLNAAQLEKATAQARPHAYLVIAGEPVQSHAVGVAARLRDKMPRLRLLTHCGGGSLKAQFRRADRSGADVALVIGADEMQNDTVTVKPLRDSAVQQTLSPAELEQRLQTLIAHSCE